MFHVKHSSLLFNLLTQLQILTTIGDSRNLIANLTANCNVSEVEGVISPAYQNLRKKIELNPKYFDYYFKIQYEGWQWLYIC